MTRGLLFLIPIKVRLKITNNTRHPSINNLDWWSFPFGGNYRYLSTMIEILDWYNPLYIIETGTFVGTTTKFFSKFSSEVFSIEISKEFIEIAKKNLSNAPNITLILGDSSIEIKNLIDNHIDSGQKSFFYLDAHWETNLPLQTEVSLILQYFLDFIIVIDDFKNEFDTDFSFDSYDGIAIGHELIHSIDPQLACFIPQYLAKSEWSISDKPKSFGVVCREDSSIILNLLEIGLLRCCSKRI
jgi:SAM-dependent methyltransferase